jgi:hypothetical protein
MTKGPFIVWNDRNKRRHLFLKSRNHHRVLLSLHTLWHFQTMAVTRTFPTFGIIT